MVTGSIRVSSTGTCVGGGDSDTPFLEVSVASGAEASGDKERRLYLDLEVDRVALRIQAI